MLITREMLVDNILQQVNWKECQGASHKKFLRCYLSAMSGDLLQVPILEGVVQAANWHWDLAFQRKPRQSIIKIHPSKYYDNSDYISTTAVRIVCEDVPFLVDSIRNVIQQHDYPIKVLHNLAGYGVLRDAEGYLTEFDHASSRCESYMWFELGVCLSRSEQSLLMKSMEGVLKDVYRAVKDWSKMQKHLQGVGDSWGAIRDKFAEGEYEEAIEFINWMMEYFTFLGYRRYDLSPQSRSHLVLSSTSSLGVLRSNPSTSSKKSLSKYPKILPEKSILNSLFYFTKTNTFSTVHRSTYTDMFVVKRFDAKGGFVGEDRFIGLMTSDAYDSDPTKIPLIRKKVMEIVRQTQYRSRFSNKSLLYILKRLPREELFQADFNHLYDLSNNILDIRDRPQIRLFCRNDVLNRFVSCMLYIPRDRFSTKVRLKIQSLLLNAFNSNEVYSTPVFSESILARIHFIFRTNPESLISYDVSKLQEKIELLTEPWTDNFTDQLGKQYDAILAGRYSKYSGCFSAAYHQIYSPLQASRDLPYIIKAIETNCLQLRINRSKNSSYSLMIFEANDRTITLSKIVPILEYMGFELLNEQCVQENINGTSVHISKILAMPREEIKLDLEDCEDNFYQALKLVLSGDVDNDSFNYLIFTAQLNIREVNLLRAYACYLKQLGFTLTHTSIAECLNKHYLLTQELIGYFKLKFGSRRKVSARILLEHHNRLFENLSTIQNLNEDKILRSYIELISGTVRTNYRVKNAETLCLKMAISTIPLAKKPRPYMDIFVYSKRFEGVHLRMSSVARGGLRWSDRYDDYRTEVHDLMTAQEVKNALIVPAGAKGGFVCKQLHGTDPKVEVLECYRLFISSLLSMVDNMKNGVVVKKPEVTSYDDDDTYFVVAADKGTSTFSDEANEIANQNDFWLGDAFASGGCYGYDHKKLGITARGAWESVKWHFTEIGKSVDQPYTMVGIGDMGGDVFGNGLLLARSAKLVAAFNHKHIFLDPDPDIGSSYQERKRLFNGKKSQWTDYNSELISQGGGVFSRCVKSIPISSQVRKSLGIVAHKLTPNELIQAILKAPCDLLWNGGIGTYVKASSESHQDVGDNHNIICRVDGDQLRVKIIGEGGNLGFTQLARIEAAANGVRINTDFIDNSAGVDCSDHEVNLKILLDDLLDKKKMTFNDRNKLLQKLSDNVCALVLKNNQLQNIILSLSLRLSKRRMGVFRRLIEQQESYGNLDRSIEFLPTNEELRARVKMGEGLYRPEMSILLCHVKNKLQKDILNSNIPEMPLAQSMLFSLFPKHICEKYSTELQNHRLKRQLIATDLSNRVVNEGGITFVQRISEELNRDVIDVIKAFSIAREMFQVEVCFECIEKARNNVSNAIYKELLIAVSSMLKMSVRWLLKHDRFLSDSQESSVDVSKIIMNVEMILTKFQRKSVSKLIGVLRATSLDLPAIKRLVLMRYIYVYLNVLKVADELKLQDLEKLIALFNFIYTKLHINNLREKLLDRVDQNRWDLIQRSSLEGDIDKSMMAMCLQFYKKVESSDVVIDKHHPVFKTWLKKYSVNLNEWFNIVNEIKSSSNNGFSVFSIASRYLEGLAKLN
ncbi:MAG TPA: NAD-glutamate dehydrogenase [Gammaproteobacteria bacterium]|nr:NAD-glutamate dehydrogenase [Gammaproteobacteria bacterium]